METRHVPYERGLSPHARRIKAEGPSTKNAHLILLSLSLPFARDGAHFLSLAHTKATLSLTFWQVNLFSLQLALKADPKSNHAPPLLNAHIGHLFPILIKYPHYFHHGKRLLDHLMDWWPRKHHYPLTPNH